MTSAWHLLSDDQHAQLEPFRNARWCDTVLSRIGHGGWYTDDDGHSGETVRGMVLSLSHARFVAAAVWTGCDVVDIDRSTIYDCEDEAARAADGLAERAAEQERDYGRTWSLYSELEDLTHLVLDGFKQNGVAVADVLRDEIARLAEVREKFDDARSYYKWSHGEGWVA